MSIVHLCHGCQIVDKGVSACSKCHSTFYCSRTCQTLDWKTHKKFCKETDRELAISRREACLNIINSSPYCIFRYLFLQKSLLSPGFLLVVGGSWNPIYVDMGEHLEMIKSTYTISEEVYSRIQTVVERSIQVDAKRLICKGIPVLYVEKTVCSVYVVGSDKMVEESRQVDNLPPYLLDKIVKNLLKIKQKDL